MLTYRGRNSPSIPRGDLDRASGFQMDNSSQPPGADFPGGTPPGSDSLPTRGTGFHPSIGNLPVSASLGTSRPCPGLELGLMMRSFLIPTLHMIFPFVIFRFGQALFADSSHDDFRPPLRTDREEIPRPAFSRCRTVPGSCGYCSRRLGPTLRRPAHRSRP